MKKTNFQHMTMVLFIIVLASAPASLGSEGVSPVADAGLPRYAARDSVVLDGTGSYDPDNSGPFSYTWIQISGPLLTITNADTATPAISGFDQTDEIQQCEFELIISDGELTSSPDIVKVIIVPNFDVNTLKLQNPSFDPNKPTFIYFGGGNCIAGSGSWTSPAWIEKANIINFPTYSPGRSDGGPRNYYKYGDMIIVYLSRVAPEYKQPIQTSGYSTGGQPAIDVGIRLNLTYADARYAINRVTFFDATTYCRAHYSESIADFLSSAVEGEQCWVDAYVSTTSGGGITNYPPYHENVLNVWFPNATGEWGQRHALAQNWYMNSLDDSDMNYFNNGIIAGAYFSVVGPGKNLQLVSIPGAQTYKFQWYGNQLSGEMDFYDQTNHPGRLPEPVTLLAPIDVGDPNGAVLTCAESENAVGYQLLFGIDQYRVMDYSIISDTPSPPNEVITTLPLDTGWWTVRVYDHYGSTIYADPIYIGVSNLSFPVENLITGKKYCYLQDAINDAAPGDEIVVKEGIYHEKINFQGKNLTLRSTNPSDSIVVAATVITGDGNGNLVTFSNNEDAGCIIAGFTIKNANNGIYCSGSSPTITNCSIVGNVSDGIKLYMGSNPAVSNCIIAGNGDSAVAMLKFIAGRVQYFNSPTITNCTIVDNSNIGISDGIPTVLNSIIYDNGVQITGSSAVVTYSNVQGGFPGEGNIDADPLFADPANSDYHLLTGSPCIDTGDPSTPVGSEPEPNGSRINIGAYGGTPQAGLSQ